MVEDAVRGTAMLLLQLDQQKNFCSDGSQPLPARPYCKVKCYARIRIQGS